MIKFGVLVESIDLSQHGIQLLNNLNSLVDKYAFYSPIVFYRTYSQPISPPFFSLMQHAEVWGFDSPVITSSPTLLLQLLQCPQVPRIIFYVWNLDWMYAPNTPLQHWTNIYQNDRVELVARSQHHAKIIENCWKKPTNIIKDFDYEGLTKLLV